VLSRCGAPPDALAGLLLTDNDTRGTVRLREAVSSAYNGRVSPDTIVATTGTSEALFILFNLLLERGASAVVPSPSFQALTEVPRAIGADLRFYRLTDENGYIPDPDEICRLIDHSTGVVVINTPHTPSGAVIPRAYAEAVIECAERHGAAVLFDEHYRFLPVEGDRHFDTFASPERNVIATGSVTKCFGVTGLRAGWIAVPAKLAVQVCAFRDYLTHTLSPVSDYLSALVLEERGRFIPPLVETIRENIGAMEAFVTGKPRWSWVRPGGGLVAFPRYGYPVDTDRFCRELIERSSVFLLPGSSFGTENHVRINLGQDPSLFREALELIGMYSDDLEGTQ
jgi:aspartate/methionine/tyrosine aminotransferase